MQKFRITFFVNYIKKPFTWKLDSFDKTVEFGNILADFALGRDIESKLAEFPQAKSMIKAYRTYRCSHEINHYDLINISGMTIDQLDDFGNWWTISNNNEEIEFKLGEEMAYDTPHNAYKNYF